ncbi:hypothetical protein Q1695_006172 [Nippostrongylus brasiliensis]|nr:hypothetical protein Q1695_006172 [Nippostrongylus brasiliensis]
MTGNDAVPSPFYWATLPLFDTACTATRPASFRVSMYMANAREGLKKDRAAWKNGTIYFSEVVDSMDPSHPLYLLYNITELRYNYGGSSDNLCRLTMKPSNSLPSLLHVMELKIAPQACIRIAVLSGLVVKMLVCMVKMRADAAKASDDVGLLSVCRSSPFLQLACDAVLVFIVCLQHEQDKDLRWVMRYHVQTFCILFLSFGFTYSASTMKSLKSDGDHNLLLLRIFGLIVFAFSATSVHETFASSLQHKPCHAYVPAGAALQEYLCIAVFVLFSASLLFDCDMMVVNLVSLLPDTIPPNELKGYSPLFMSTTFDSAPFAKLRASESTVTVQTRI